MAAIRRGVHPASAIGAFEDIDGPHSHEEVGPAHTLGALGREGDGALGGRRGDDDRADMVVGCEDAIEAA